MWRVKCFLLLQVIKMRVFKNFVEKKMIKYFVLSEK